LNAHKNLISPILALSSIWIENQINIRSANLPTCTQSEAAQMLNVSERTLRSAKSIIKKIRRSPTGTGENASHKERISKTHPNQRGLWNAISVTQKSVTADLMIVTGMK